jgi:hypothetical protein
MRWETLFDVAETGYRHWWFPVGIAVFVLIVFAALIAARAAGETRPWRSWIKPYALAATAALVVPAAAFLLTYRDYSQLRDALREGRYRVVEGPVTQLAPADRGDHFDEVIVVNSQRYAYSRSRLSAGFNRTRVLREGLRVRIADVNGSIARLEVLR